jgi:hypothetical protein
MKKATLWTGIILTVVGTIMAWASENDSLVALGLNFIATGVAFTMISVILRIKK